jgi:hypothetical protein
MSAAQSALVVLAMFLGVAGSSLSVSAAAIPALPGFRDVRRKVAWLASLSLAASIALISWVVVRA